MRSFAKRWLNFLASGPLCTTCIICNGVCDHPETSRQLQLCTSCLSKLPVARITDSQNNPLTRRIWPHAPITHAFWLMSYGGTAKHKHIILDAKFNSKPHLMRALGHLAPSILQYKFDIEHMVDAIVPVPLYWKHQLKRTYNQSHWLAEGLAEAYHLPIEKQLLHRCKAGNKQHELGREDRFENAKDLYQATIHPSQTGRHYLLVDDICTTGATLSNCAMAILKADPTARISVFVAGMA